MFYTIYKTTNIINGKFYIGKHQTKELNDGYLGSGKRLKYAIDKYGIDNFHKEILHVCESEKQMNILEKILVVPDDEINYNLCPGGHGGFGYIRDNLPNGMIGKTQTQKQIDSARQSQIILRKKLDDPDFYRTWKTSLKDRRPSFKDKKHNVETKQKISKTMREKQKGKLNSQYGTCWITNGVENKKIKKEDLDSWIELGYSRGRKLGP